MSRRLTFPGGTQQVMVRLPKDQYDALMDITERDGVPLAEQFRRAVKAYLAAQAKPVRRSKPARVSLRPKHAIND